MAIEEWGPLLLLYFFDRSDHKSRVFYLRGCLVGVIKFNNHCDIFVLFDNYCLIMN